MMIAECLLPALRARSVAWATRHGEPHALRAGEMGRGVHRSTAGGLPQHAVSTRFDPGACGSTQHQELRPHDAGIARRVNARPSAHPRTKFVPLSAAQQFPAQVRPDGRTYRHSAGEIADVASLQLVED
jgi:hypothetical protein